MQILSAQWEYNFLLFQESGGGVVVGSWPYLRHRHSLWRATVQNDHPVDWHLLPLGVLLKVFPQVCVGR